MGIAVKLGIAEESESELIRVELEQIPRGIGLGRGDGALNGCPEVRGHVLGARTLQVDGPGQTLPVGQRLDAATIGLKVHAR